MDSVEVVDSRDCWAVVFFVKVATDYFLVFEFRVFASEMCLVEGAWPGVGRDFY